MVSPETHYQAEGDAERAERRERRPPGEEPAERRAEPRAERRRERRSASGVVFGSSAEVIAGAGAIVLGILGLLGIFPLAFAAIATLAIGAGILLEGASIAARMRAAQEEIDGRSARRAAGGGVSAEVLGGGAGVVLSILALVGIFPLVLLPIAALVYGATLLFLGATRPALVELTRPHTPMRRASDRAEQASESAVASSGGALLLAGAASAVLGILVLAEVAPTIPMVLISMLAIGAALLLSGSTLVARVSRALRAA